MKSVRFFILSLLALFLLVTAIGLLFSSRVTVVRQIDIQASQSKIIADINQISQWPYWMVDSSIQISYYTNIKSGKGASAQVANRKATITDADNNHVYIDWEASKGKIENSGFTLFPSHTIPNGTTVEWYFTKTLKWYPWERITAVFYEKMLGPSMELDLKRLKEKTERER